MTATRTAGQPDLPPGTVALVLVTVTLALHLAGPGPVIPVAATSPGQWADWFSRTAAIEIVVALIRLLSLATCYHLLAMQLLSVLARVVNRPHLAQIADRLTPPPLRTSARRLAGIGLAAASALALPATRADAGPSTGRALMQVVDLGTDTGTASITVVSTPQVDNVAPTAEQDHLDLGAPHASGTAVLRVDVESTTEAEQTAATISLDRQHVVRPGDHLWAIARAELARAEFANGSMATDESVVYGYWQQIVLANPQLDDPDLVFPGDVVVLPPMGQTG